MPSASDIVALAGLGTAAVGWKLSSDARRTLLHSFPPSFRNTLADRVILMRNVANDTPLPSEDRGRIVGWAHDARGVEAMIVAIGGTCHRPGGGTYHITWSLADGARDPDLPEKLDDHDWVRFGVPIPVKLVPAAL